MKVVLLENIRSAYNVGNVIRTADSLGRDVRLSGYTPSPEDNLKVKKTSLGAEKNVNLSRFNSTKLALNEAKKIGLEILASEITDTAIPLDRFIPSQDSFLIIFGNEIYGVDNDTLKTVDDIVYIPMQGIKKSMNIGQSTAIVMRHLGKI